MSDTGVWSLEEKEPGRYALTHPNDVTLFPISLNELEMLASMFQDEVKVVDEILRWEVEP